MTKNQAIKHAKEEVREATNKRPAAWIITDNPEEKKVTVTAYSARARYITVKKEYN